MQKSDKKLIQEYNKSTGISSDHDITTVRFQKEPFTTAGGVASKRYLFSILFELKQLVRFKTQKT